MPNDYSTDEDLNSLQPVDPARAFTRPGHTFKGLALHPYSHGMDLLLTQVTDPAADTNLFHWLAFIFLHLVRDQRLSAIDDRKRYVLPLAWNIDVFRAVLVDWLDEIKLNDLDKLEAKRVYDAMRGEAAAAAVEVAPAAGTKKAGSVAPNETAFLLATFAGSLTRDEILWSVPLAELNQRLHVHYYREGLVCRRPGAKGKHFAAFEETLRKLTRLPR